MLIAQISDLHIRAHGAEGFHGLDNNANLRAAVSMLNALDPGPDVVIATGDLTNYGKLEEYAALRDLLAPLRPPLYLIPGNHDNARHIRDTLPEHDYLPGGDQLLNYVVDGYPLRLVGLDSTLAGCHNGTLCAERLDWLRSTLEVEPERPTLLFMHHPPFESGIWWMDGIGIVEGIDGLRDLLDSNPQVQRIVCGHLHRAIHSSLGRTPVSVCPSTTYAVCLDTVPESPPKFIAEPPALQLHRWTGEALVSHTAYVDFPAEPIDLRPLMPNWEERRELIRNGMPIPKSVHY